MRNYIFYIILYGLLIPSSAIAQQDSTQKIKYPVNAAGFELRADGRSSWELTYKRLNPGLNSFGIKIAGYSYDEEIPPITVQSVINNIGVSHKYVIEGVSLKVGWIMGNSITKYTVSGASLYAIGLMNAHQYSRTYKDGRGSQTDSYSRIDYRWGGEFECYSGLKLGKVLVCLVFQFGVKPAKVYLYDDLVKDLPAYVHYSPTQGYGTLRAYVNGSLGVSYMF